MKKKPITILISLATALTILTACDTSEKLTEKGNGYLKDGMYKKAEAQYEKALKMDPKSADAYRGIIAVYSETEDPESAYEYLEKAKENLSESEYKKIATKAYNSALTNAEAYLEEKEYELAIVYYEMAIDIDPESEEAYEGIALAYSANNDRYHVNEYLDTAKENLSENSYDHMIDQYNSSVLEVLGDIQTAVLTAMMDPEIVNDPEFNEDFKKYYGSPVNMGEIKSEDGPIERGILEILNAQDGQEVVSKIMIPGINDPQVLVQAMGSWDIQVWVEGCEDLVVE